MQSRSNILNLQVSSQRIDKVYNIRNTPESTLGTGSFGFVVKAEDKTTGQMRAVKIIKKDKLQKIDANLTLLANELKIMLQMDHPNIIRLYEVYEDPKYFYFVMEFMKGNTLFATLLSEDNNLTENSIRMLFADIMRGIRYLHSCGVCHRDIKPENIMFVGKKNSHVKIIDFGVSKYFFSPENPKKEITLRTQAGSLYYISPEIMEGAYDSRCDIWSAGVILYSLFAGVPPFFDMDPNVVLKKVKNMEYDFKEPVWEQVSPQVIDLIRKMLTKRDIRFTADQVLEHEWMKMNLEHKTYEIQLGSLKKFLMGSTFSKYVLEIIAACSSETDNENMGAIFVDIDTDGDGLITRDELLEGIQDHFNIFDKELSDMITTKYKPTQKLNYTNFLTLVNSMNNYSNFDKRVEKAFNLIDRKGTGKIDGVDIQNALKKMKIQDIIENDSWDDLIKEVDKDGKGYLDLNDFKNMMRFYVNN